MSWGWIFKTVCRGPGPLKCGSELARDGGLTFNIAIDCYTAIASKLAPTGA